MNRKPPVCPVHSDVLDAPMVFIQTWDGRDWYECPVPRCSCAIDYPAAVNAGPDPHFDHAHSTDPEI